jgi:hypothetical protein
MSASLQLVNSQYFREAALDFERNKAKGYLRYTMAPRQSKEWWDYWKEQEKRCLYGYTVGGVTVTGKHYFYMNFTPIQRVEGKGKTERKYEGFPGFWEIDYNWWWYKEIAWWGCTLEDLANLSLWRDPSDITGGLHLSCVKTRRAGFSYKEAADGVYNYNFIPGSKNYFLADKEDYLIKDGILNKVQADLDWLNKYTDGFWLKNRHRHNTLMHQEAAYLDMKDKQIKGFLSQIMGVVIAGDPDKARGKDGLKVTFEEGGSFKNLKAALDIVVPSVRAGRTITGQISVFGTGGEEGQDIEGLDEIFNDPKTYDMLPFVNDWEEGYESTECGVFIPCYMANDSFISPKTGLTDKDAAIAYDDEERLKAKGAKDPKKFDRRIAEFPRTPTDALIRVNVNNFPVGEAKYQLSRVLKDLSLQGVVKHGQFLREVEGLKFIPQTLNEARPVLKFPHKKGDDIEGCISILKEPARNAAGVIPEGMYIINVDPFYDDEADDVTSLGSIYVTKVFDNFTATHSMDVAWFNGRPRSLTTFHEAIFDLAEYYNAKVQCEVGGGGKGVLDYAITKKKLKYLEFTGSDGRKEIDIDKKNRTYLMTISTDDKRQGLTYYQDYLKQVVGYTETGAELLNIHFVYDLGLLWEIIKFNPLKNADRISSQIVKMLRMRGQIMTKPKDAKKKRKRLIDRIGTNDPGESKLTTLRIKDGEVII